MVDRMRRRTVGFSRMDPVRAGRLLSGQRSRCGGRVATAAPAGAHRKADDHGRADHDAGDSSGSLVPGDAPFFFFLSSALVAAAGVVTVRS